MPCQVGRLLGTLKNRVDADDVRRVAAAGSHCGSFSQNSSVPSSPRGTRGRRAGRGRSLLKVALHPPRSSADSSRRCWLIWDGSRTDNSSTKCLPSEIIPVLAGESWTTEGSAGKTKCVLSFAKELKVTQRPQSHALRTRFRMKSWPPRPRGWSDLSSSAVPGPPRVGHELGAGERLAGRRPPPAVGPGRLRTIDRSGQRGRGGQDLNSETSS